MHLPFDEVCHRMGIVWEKITYTMGKVWTPISQVNPIRCVLLHFPVVFPICWSIPQDRNRMKRKHSYYGKSMSISLPDFPHTMGFVASSRTVGNLWGNSCISHMLKYTTGWESDGKKASILWGKYEYQFPKLSTCHGFCCTFPQIGKFMGKPMHFP